MEEFQKIKLIMLDVDNTLLDFELCARSCWKKVAKEFGFTLPEDLDAVFHRINDSLWQDLEKGLLTIDDIHRVRWKKIFSAIGREDYAAKGEAFEEAFVEKLKWEREPVEGALEVLSYLAGKYTLLAGTNGPWDQQYMRLRDAHMLPYLKGGLFVSEEIGFSKPQRPFFEACLAKMKEEGKIPEEDITPEKMLMIGDSLTADIIGAKEFGMKTLWYDHKNKGMGAKGSDKADVRVEKLTEILRLL